MISEIAAAVQSAKVLADLVRAASGVSNHVEITAAVHAVQEKLSQALISNLAGSEKQAALQERVRDLENQIAQSESWATQMARYHLLQFPTGALAYAVNKGLENGQPLHYLCTACVDKKQTSTLQPHGRLLYCPVCKTDIAMQSAPPVAVVRSRGSWMSR